MTTSIDYRTTTETLEHCYVLSARNATDPGLVEIAVYGCTRDGEVRGEGSLTVPADDLIHVTKLVDRTVAGLATLSRKPGTTRVLPIAEHRNQPWTDALDAELIGKWRALSDLVRPHTAHRELGDYFGRSPGAVRSRLLKLGCDPDNPGAPLKPVDLDRAPRPDVPRGSGPEHLRDEEREFQ
jgi:hypothetical protein